MIELLQWLVDSLQQLFIETIDVLLQGLSFVFSLIPAPDFLQNINIQFPETALFMIQIFEMPFGIAVVVSAYTFRFILRRIPGLG